MGNLSKCFSRVEFLYALQNLKSRSWLTEVTTMFQWIPSNQPYLSGHIVCVSAAQILFLSYFFERSRSFILILKYHQKFSFILDMPETQSKLLVIGAGLPRTGTLSLSYALETLFGGKCYHMKPFLEKGTDYDTKHWQDALVKSNFLNFLVKVKNCCCYSWEKEAYRRGESLPKERWVGLLEKRGFITAVDFPVSFYFEVTLTILRRCTYLTNKMTQNFRIWSRCFQRLNLFSVCEAPQLGMTLWRIASWGFWKF